jgi:hypothetical protein
MEFKTFIELGDHYRDEDTKFEGVATAVTFYRQRVPRVCLTALVSSVPADHWFDEPQLTFIDGDKAMGFG